jgi:hypothetical protein
VAAILPLVVEAWDWRVSAFARLASLAATWLVFAVPVEPAWLLVAVSVLRFGSSPVQLWLNTRLGRNDPLEPRDRLDWALFALLIAAVLIVSAMTHGESGPAHGLVLVPALVPFSLIQLRQCRRSLRAHRAARTAGGGRRSAVPPRPGHRTSAAEAPA